MSGPMYSFRVTSPTVRALLDKLPHRSRFIRDAVTERLLGDAAGIPMKPAGQGSVDSHTAPPDELRSGLAAISKAVTALMTESSGVLSTELRAGLGAIAEAAERLATDPGGSQQNAPPDAPPHTPPIAAQDQVADPEPVTAPDTPSAPFPNSDKDTQS